jgi:hypothetical protein
MCCAYWAHFGLGVRRLSQAKELLHHGKFCWLHLMLMAASMVAQVGT